MMRRGSRKKQDVSSLKEEASAPSVASGAGMRQQPSQEILQKQRKKQQDEISNFTAKNYRLAKELADLRLKHRDECKHVTRLTMENMNLASRCREAISHVAMLKKELAMQQKRTTQALASQREQTKRMADSLTNSFISFSSPNSVESNHRSGDMKSKSHRISVGTDEDENVMMLVSTTPSPDRDGLRHRLGGNDHSNNDQNVSHSKLVAQTSAVSATTIINRTTRPKNPMEEARDSPASTATNSPTSELDEDETVLNSIALASSSLSESPEKEKNDVNNNKKIQNLPVVYSTPKKSERSKFSQLHVQRDNEFDTSTTEKAGLFPFSASPQVLNKTNLNCDKKSYDEGFPPDAIDQPESNNDGKHAKSKLKMNIMNSIDAFDKSFSTDFPDSFTPKESDSNSSLPASGSGQKIYNPFFATPEKLKHHADSSVYSTQNEIKTTCGPTTTSQIEYKTPPKNAKDVALTNTDRSDKVEIRPKRPEKTIPSAARSRYQRALGPRVESSDRSKESIGNDSEQSSSSDGKSPGVLFRRIQQKKRLGKSLESISNGSTVQGSSGKFSLSEQKHEPNQSILNIIDTFEQNDDENGQVEKERNLSTASRYQGPIQSLRRRSVKKPISYAEPPLNTKLRRGDIFFPKTSPNTILGDCDNGDDQNQAPNLIQATAVVSP